MKSLKIVNLTPHGVRLVSEKGEIIVEFPPSGQIARLIEEEETLPQLKVEGVKIPFYKKKLEEVENLPSPEEGTFYIVSLPIAQALPERGDLLVPHKLVRDERGRVVGARALATLSDIEASEEEASLNSNEKISSILASSNDFEEARNKLEMWVREPTTKKFSIQKEEKLLSGFYDGEEFLPPSFQVRVKLFSNFPVSNDAWGNKNFKDTAVKIFSGSPNEKEKIREEAEKFIEEVKKQGARVLNRETKKRFEAISEFFKIDSDDMRDSDISYSFYIIDFSEKGKETFKEHYQRFQRMEEKEDQREEFRDFVKEKLNISIFMNEEEMEEIEKVMAVYDKQGEQAAMKEIEKVKEKRKEKKEKEKAEILEKIEKIKERFLNSNILEKIRKGVRKEDIGQIIGRKGIRIKTIATITGKKFIKINEGEERLSDDEILILQYIEDIPYLSEKYKELC